MKITVAILGISLTTSLAFAGPYTWVSHDNIKPVAISYFRFRGYVLDIYEIRRIANLITERDPGKRLVLIIGHSDSVGASFAKNRISYQRAENTMEQIKRITNLRFRIAIEGHGDSQPMVHREGEQKLNRRIEIFILPI